MDTVELMAHWSEEIFEFREVPGRGLCGLSRMLYTVGLIVDLQELNYKGRYCFPDLRSARDGLQEWKGKGDPPGPWIKHKGEGGEYGNPALLSADLFQEGPAYQDQDGTGHD
jgi:hypothetical protein